MFASWISCFPFTQIVSNTRVSVCNILVLWFCCVCRWYMQIIPSSPNVLTGPEAGVDLRMILKRWDNDIGSCHYQKALRKLQYLNMIQYGYQVTCFHLLKCNLKPIGYNLTKQLFFISCMYANNDQVGWKQQKCQNSEQKSWWMLRVRSIYKMHNIIIRKD